MVVPRGTAAPILLKWFVSRDVPTGAPYSNGTIIPIPIPSFPFLVYLHSRKFIRSTDRAKSGVLVRASRPIILPDIIRRSSSETRARKALFHFVPVLHFLLIEKRGFLIFRIFLRPTGRTFTIVGNACPLTRITTTTEVPLRKSSALDNKTPKPVVTLVYSRKPRKSNTSVPVNNYKVVQIVLWPLKHSSSGPALHEMNPATISSGLVSNLHPSTPFVPPSRTDWDMLFQPLFDEFLNPSPSVDHPAPEVIAPVLADSTGSPSSTTVDQDAPSPSNSQTTPETKPPVIPNDVEEDDHDIEVA
ncbi:hypothetical protein Tco_0730606, partial [Tanacetum coccineum]